MMETSLNEFAFQEVPRMRDIDKSKFEDIIKAAKPVLLEGCDFGKCMSVWNLDYLTEVLGQEQTVIHESKDKELDFVDKNFKYRQYSFKEFAKLINETKPDKCSVYLRSTNHDPRSQKAANISVDYPILSEDLKPPSYIPYGNDDRLYHSSVLRIASANVQIWTHFDLYNNVLCQVAGTKRVILIPPEDTKYLYTKGDKSRVNCFDNLDECMNRFPLITKATLHSCILGPKDCLYIPSLWWHNIRTIGAENNSCSIGFNIFWKDVDIDDKLFYAESDVYGNKNLKPYESALANLDKALQHLAKLPSKYRNFHKMMLYEQFKRKFGIDYD